MESSKLQPYPDFEFFDDLSWQVVYRSVYQNRCALVLVGFQFLFVTCVLLCGVTQARAAVEETMYSNILSGQLWLLWTTKVSWVTKSKVQVGTFFPFTAKVDSKSTKITQIYLQALRPSKTDRFSEQQCPRIYIRAYLSSRQIDAIVDIYDHCLKSLPVLKHQPNKVFIRSDPGCRFERKIQEEQKIAQP